MVRNFQYIFHRNDETYWNCLLKKNTFQQDAYRPLPQRGTFHGDVPPQEVYLPAVVPGMAPRRDLGSSIPTLL